MGGSLMAGGKKGCMLWPVLVIHHGDKPSGVRARRKIQCCLAPRLAILTLLCATLQTLTAPRHATSRNPGKASGRDRFAEPG